MLIPAESVREVVNATDIVDLVGRYVALKRSGRNFVGLCPFHREKTPSFNVSPDRGSFKCFGCGVGGDAITFVQEHDRVEFVEAVQLLADRAGIDLPRNAQPDAPTGPRRVDVLGALERATAWFRRQLGSEVGASARAYCERRGITAASIETFQLGYAPNDGQALVRALRGAKVPMEIAAAAGLVRTSDRDGRPYAYFRDRLIFPITDAQDRVVGFGGRVLGDGEPKYLNSPDSPLFQKRKLVYGLSQARHDERDTPLLVMEGYTDVILTRQHGVPGPVATLGTALTADHLRTLGRQGRPVIIVFDGDNAGLAAAEKTAELALTEDADVSLVALPAGLDPADCVGRDGPEAFTALLDRRQEAVAFRVERLRAAHDLRTHAGQRRAGDAMADLLARVENPIARDLLARRAADALNLDEAALRKGASGRRAAQPPAPAEDAPPAERPLGPGTLAELDCIIAILGEPTLAATARECVPLEWLRDEQCRSLLEHTLALAESGAVPQLQDLRATFPADGYRPYLVRCVDLMAPGEPPARLLAAARQALELRELDDARAAWEREVASADRRGDTPARNDALRELAAVIQRRAEVARSVDALEDAAIDAANDTPTGATTPNTVEVTRH